MRHFFQLENKFRKNDNHESIKTANLDSTLYDFSLYFCICFLMMGNKFARNYQTLLENYRTPPNDFVICSEPRVIRKLRQV